jgi:hypothetical protein
MYGRMPASKYVLTQAREVRIAARDSNESYLRLASARALEGETLP